MLPVVLCGFCAFLDLYATQPLLPMLMRVFNATHFAVSLTVTASTVAVAIAAPIVGRLADLAGRKRVIVGSAFCLAAATLLAATAGSLGQFIGWRFVQGLATPGIFGIAIAYVHGEWPETHVGRAMSAYISGTVTGGFCGRAMVGVLSSRYGWQVGFAVLGVVNVLVAVALAKWLPREKTRADHEAGTHGRSVLRLLSHPQLIATNIVGFCVLFSQVAMFSYVTFHLSDPPFGLSTAALGWLFVVYLVGAAVTPIAGHWIDRKGHRAGVAIGVGVGFAGAMMTLVPSLAVIVAGLALVGSGVFIAQATSTSYIGKVTERDRGLAVGLYSTFYYIGGTIGGALPALFWDAGGWVACVLLVMGVQLITAFVALTSWTTRR